ncbi:MAG TPA: hypothetical protein VGC79_12210, partial [Polyangiaceae bacterium]
MNPEVNKLQELLARVQRNAALPRTLVSGRLREASAPVHEAPPVTFSAPAFVAPVAEFTAEEIFFESEPPPPPASPVYVPEFADSIAPPPPASLDSSVDELLLEDPFPSAPPPAAPSYSEVLEEEPIPLVAVAPQRPLDNEDDVSGVVPISEFAEEPEELLEDDIVEMTSAEAAALPGASGALDELSFDDDDLGEQHVAPPSEDEPPASSSRSKIAGTMDEALARAAEQIELEEGREVPLKTPPPESGPQAAIALPAGIHAPLAPDIEELLEADIMPSAGVRAAVPTAEQLGQTIDLEEARGPSIELDHPLAHAPEALEEEPTSEELEVTLPGREFVGGYQADLMPPPEARQDLDAHRQRLGDDSVPPPPESLAQ